MQNKIKIFLLIFMVTGGLFIVPQLSYATLYWQYGCIVSPNGQINCGWYCYPFGWSNQVGGACSAISVPGDTTGSIATTEDTNLISDDSVITKATSDISKQ